jgi:hypothetical protein
MKTYKQWCEQQQNKNPLADDLSNVTTNALKTDKNPAAAAKDLLTKHAVQAQVTGDSDKAAEVTNAATKLNVSPKPRKMKKK